MKRSLPLWLLKAGCEGHISLYLFPSSSYLMASPFVVAAAQACKDRNKNNASFRSMKRSWSSNESSYGSSAATKSCVCAPATHAGSFKCRLHRVWN
ncbi:uncharacterized protein LOC131246487 isoform X3 [Magnolia sinica]|uniref:uncharacterized protein LOC131246487 isoform X3 n=1 Tax=Magnolia sinica TaxID=86752 RepID=UPI0026585CE1|nr:uncharacterized protein LOC131246487 isoform X3 [Magnolia sinica]XP_058102648.1 uncharacterized protein LOC131246487 isoform X3 [Magnolia sinica]XP_058102649.1 uncharacterized protein LOC131246487 isoform X3 [Magnolia sinica]XP_058102650.1 uncharacterized protein LOC131246487 isoform X3 [Magnolia sinica]XP_058102651.1 uncharacterized protein LOC131246487 isoform X3 [Magnolia sinica]XP_058102652.1 uncharacterized protein LOC131246487 isoform X3 [Magnolia sinica]